MNKKNKNMLIRIIITFVLFVVIFIIDKLNIIAKQYSYVLLLVCMVPYLLIGYDIVLRAFKNILNGQVFDENFLMMIATFGAFGTGEYLEAVAVMLFYQIGELFQKYAVNKSRQSISDMMNICPEYANVEEDGELTTVDPDDVQIDSIIIIKPGERVPLDGVVVEGESYIDTSALTGESVPSRVTAGDDIISGCVNGNNILKVRVTKLFEDSTVSRILELVENASARKAQVENFITRFSRYYTPIVTIAALLLTIIPPFILGGTWGEWLHRACIFLVISCPCALVISVPLGFFGGIGAASKNGILVKGSNYLEAVSRVKTVVFDKTGTLTNGSFKVTKITPVNCTSDFLLEYAALAEGYSTHPIAESIKEKCREENIFIDLSRASDYTQIPGMGIKVNIDGKVVLAGNNKLLMSEGIEYVESSDFGTVIYIAFNGQFCGCIIISDTIKEHAKQSIIQLKRSGIRKTVMLTGDTATTAQSVASQVGIDEVHAHLLPEDKVRIVENILEKSGSDKDNLTAFVGDGINDAPVLMRADVGIAMGSMGSDAAIEAADIVLMDDDISKIAVVRDIAVKTIRIVKQNIVFALAVKLIVLILGALGIANMWEAVFADVGVSVLAILNSMRMLSYKALKK